MSIVRSRGTNLPAKPGEILEIRHNYRELKETEHHRDAPCGHTSSLWRCHLQRLSPSVARYQFIYWHGELLFPKFFL